jgi:hypothetical protein
LTDFSDALRAVKEGKRVRRALWQELDGRVGSWMELVPTDQVGEVLACPVAVPDGGTVLLLFTCSQWDLLAEDWEIVEPA